MAYGLLLLRVVIGGTILAHGLQKTFGWWSGPGPQGLRGWLESMGFRMAALMTLMLILAEDGGLLLALGLVTPLAALLIVASQIVAIATTHWKNGFWSGGGGYEYNVLLIAGTLAICATGPGRFSLDHWFGWDSHWSGLWWAVGVLAASILGAAFILTALRQAPPPPRDAAA
ncbi:MAG TPA: DoxX family protein [Gaiellaceae bacterium]|jgi:putative oxidoreductase|nr:DoxX family protein [Gaiellaceae bacterium]